MSLAVCLAVLTLMVVRVIYFYNASDSVLIGVVPDDAFYYMQIARHRAFEGLWSFDGSSVATGFHLLYGYYLLFFYSIFGDIDWRHLFLIIGLMSSVFIAMASYFVSRTAEIIFGRTSILLSSVPFFTSAALIQSTAMMESWLVIFFSAATIFILLIDKEPTLSDAIVLIVVGILGSLSRSDYGMLPGVIFTVNLLGYSFFRNNRLRRSGFVLLGALIGVALVLLHNLQISGHLTQTSAQTKLFWSYTIGHSISAPLNLVMSIVYPFYDGFPFYGGMSFLVRVLILFCLMLFFYNYWRKSKLAKNRDEYLIKLIIATECLVTILAYIIFYRMNSQSIQIWYSSNFIAPLGILIAAMGYFILETKLVITALITFFIYIFICIQNIFFISWPHQIGMMKAGLFLREQNSQALYGSWNAGIIGYFSGVGLINIDGLTNDDVLPYIKSNSLYDYIKLRKIDYLIDYEIMLSRQDLRIRGGYSDSRISQCIWPLQAVDGNSPTLAGSRLFLFEVVQGCD